MSPLATGRTWLKRCSGYGSNLADWLTSSWLKVIEAPVSHVTLGRACHMISRTKQSKGKKGRGKQSKRKQSRSEANQIVTPDMSHVIPGRACHMLPWGARVTWYPGPSKAKERKGKARKANEAKQKRSKSNCDARHVTCYPRAGVSHVTPGRPCHMLSPGRACHMLSQGGRVTCYPGRPGIALRTRKGRRT